MALYVALIDGMTNATDDDLSTFSCDFLLQGGVVDLPQYTTPFAVSASGTPDTNSNIAAGVAYIPNSTTSVVQYYRILNDASIIQNHDATVSNPRIDAVVLAIDTSISPDANASTNATIEVVKGSENASPTRPSDGDITTAVGHSKWIRLADVAIANPFVTIVGGDITDYRVNAVVDGSKIYVPNGESIYFLNSSGATSARIYQASASTDLYITAVGDLQFEADGGEAHFRDNTIGKFYNTGTTKYAYINHNDTHAFFGSSSGGTYLVPTSGAAGVLVSGVNSTFSVFDAANTGYIQMGFATDGYLLTNSGDINFFSNGGDVNAKTGAAYRAWNAADTQNGGIIQNTTDNVTLFTTSGDVRLLPSADGQVVIFARFPRREYATNTYDEVFKQHGDVYLQGTSGYQLGTATVTLPVAYSDGDYTINIQCVGYSGSAPSSTASLNSVGFPVSCDVYGLSSTQFTFVPHSCDQNGTAFTFDNARYFMFTWETTGRA